MEMEHDPNMMGMDPNGMDPNDPNGMDPNQM